jgi:hypothetical protein
VEICIDSLHIGQHYLLSQYHLVERANEECIQKAPVEDCQSNHATDEFEVIKMFRINAGMRIDLKGIVVVSRVFEQAVKRVEHFVRKKEEKLSGDNYG